jgi:methylglutaconyl-CoA hydratase
LKTLETNIKSSVAEIILNRPEVRNALNDLMIRELNVVFSQLTANPEIRAIVIHGKGKAFCAGADLNWMKSTAGFNKEQTFEDSSRLATLLQKIYFNTKPTIAVVHGSVMGGANGIAAACDFAVAEENTVFAFSEVKLGIIPAMISPYIVKRIGEFPAKELMLTGRKFTAAEAEKFGLINKSLPQEKIPEYISTLLNEIFSAGSNAVSASKNLISKVSESENIEQITNFTIEEITRVRSSAEGQEGMNAFFEKRRPNWILANDYTFSFC